jgi:hypothetical protein
MAHLVTEEFGNCLTLNWNEKGEYHSGISFEWRNIPIHLKVDINIGIKSREDTITLNVNGKSYYFGFGQSSVGAGSIGIKPTIENESNFLSIIQKPNRVTLKDNVKDSQTNYK